ncbi:MAG: hypothetical protein U0804_06440 [Gemmataceae bacterium]
MRRLAFVLLATLIVGVSTASPAQGYWSLFHKPHHLPHARPHHGAYYQVAPSSDPNALTAGQIFRGIQLGGQLLWPLLNPGQQPGQTPQPAAEPRISDATSKQIAKTGEAVNKAAANVNDLLKLVRTGDPRHDDKTLPDVPKTGAAKAAGKDDKDDDDDVFKKK